MGKEMEMPAAGREQPQEGEGAGRSDASVQTAARAAALREARKQQRLARRRVSGDLQPHIRDAMRQGRDRSPKAQIDYLLSKGEFVAATGRRRRVSEKTMTMYGQTLRSAMDDLKAIGMPIWRVDSLSRKHVVGLVRHWLEQGQAPKTIQTKVSQIRVFFERLGKRDLIPDNEAWLSTLRQSGIDVARLQVKREVVSKAWDSAGVDFAEVHKRVVAEDPLVGIQMLMELAFGLRVKESHRIVPSLADVGNALILEDGTKGGRRRIVRVDQDPEVRQWQRAVIAEAKKFAESHPQGRLARRGQELKQAINRYYYVMRKCGITKAQLGVTSHGLRHQYAQRFFEDQTGLPAPVRGEMRPEDYRPVMEKVQTGMQATSEATGHWRKSITGAYLSTVAGASKAAIKRLTDALALFQDRADVSHALARLGTTELWLGGKAGMGMPMRMGEGYTLIALVGTYPQPDLLAEVAAQIETAVGVKVHLLTTTNPASRTQEMAEVILASNH